MFVFSEATWCVCFLLNDSLTKINRTMNLVENVGQHNFPRSFFLETCRWCCWCLPRPLLDKGMNFGIRVAFDSGKCTGPDCDMDWHDYGV